MNSSINITTTVTGADVLVASQDTAPPSGHLATMAEQEPQPAIPPAISAGRRPGIGWVCLAALFFKFIVRPIIMLLGVIAGQHWDLPGIDDGLWQLTTAMLGLGGLRTAEKIKGKA